MNKEISEDTRIRLPSVKVGIGTLFTMIVTSAGLCGGILFSLSDKHNYEIFLSKEEYRKDQQYISQTVKEIKDSQDEIRTDIKQILKEQSKK